MRTVPMDEGTVGNGPGVLVPNRVGRGFAPCRTRDFGSIDDDDAIAESESLDRVVEVTDVIVVGAYHHIDTIGHEAP